MTARRNPGEGRLHWEESRQRWFATVYVGYAPNGKRRKIKVSARTKTEAKAKLQQLLRDRDDGQVLGAQSFTVRDAVESWLAHGLTGRQESTVVNRTILARTHVIPARSGHGGLRSYRPKKLISGWPRSPRLSVPTPCTASCRSCASPYAARRRATW
ncbi:MAG: putative phage integrase [Propionibacteriaceae bacterium]|nr:putative phage integrase [Propionibacteriaceae bacterium]